MTTNPDEIWERIREEIQITLENIDDKPSLKRELNKLPTPKRGKTGWESIKEKDILFDAKGVQDLMFENVNEKINVAETISELNKIKVEEELKERETLETKTEQKKELIRVVTEKAIRRIIRDAVDSEIRREAAERLSEIVEEGRAEFVTLQTDLKEARDKKDSELLNETMRKISISKVLSEKNRESLLEQGETVRDMIREGK